MGGVQKPLAGALPVPDLGCKGPGLFV